MPHFMLTYTLPPEYFEVRGPYKADHLRHIAEAAADGGLVLAGAHGDPLAGATYVFDREGAAETFARGDAYVTGGVVTAWSVAPWIPIVGPGTA